MTVRDALTGAYSKAALFERLQEEVQRGLRYGEPFSLLLLDLDHFKSINDAFGHARGDSALAEFAERVQHAARGSDVLFRFGGDEFVLFLPRTPPHDARVLAHRLLRDVGDRPFEGTPPLSLTASVGLASFPDDGTTAEMLFDRADARMYEAKRAGRGQVVSVDASGIADALFEESDRLVERVDAADRAARFLAALPSARRGVLRVEGAPGSGRTRMLAEVERTARLRGLAVMAIHGRPDLRSERLAALRAAYPELALPGAGATAAECAAALRRAALPAGAPALLVCVDDAGELDPATAAALRALLSGSSRAAPAALAYVCGPDDLPLSMPQGALRETLAMAPLSPDGVRVWLRSLLRWEPPGDFLEWLQERSGGLPGAVRRIVVQLVERRVLLPEREGWHLAEGYREALPRRTGQPSQRTPMLGFPVFGLPLVGRDAALREAVRMLREAPVVTLCGPPGCGKTRLAAEVGAEALEQYPDGAVFVDARHIRTAGELAGQLAGALGVADEAGGGLHAALLRHLRRRHVLLVLDGVEVAAPTVSLLRELQEAAPDVAVLAAGPRSLGVPGEWTVELEGLRAPKWSEADRPSTAPAVQLYMERLAAASTTRAVPEADDTAISRTCLLLHGHPLSIEMAASQVRWLSCRDVLHELETNLDGTGSPHPSAAPEVRAFRAVLELAWRLMPVSLRSGVRRASLMPGAFSAAAAEHVAGLDATGLEELEHRAMLVRTGEDRWTMPPLLAEAAGARLRDFPLEREAAEAGLVEHYLGVAAALPAALRGTEDRAEVLARLAPDLPHLRLAWRTAALDRRFRPLAGAVEGFFELCAARGDWEGAEEAFGAALRCLGPGDEHGPHADLPGRLRARRGAALAAGGHPAEGVEWLGAGLKAARRRGDDAEIAFCQGALARAAALAGRDDAAREHALAALDHAHRSGDRHVESRAFLDAARARAETGDVREAVLLLLEMVDEADPGTERNTGWELLMAGGERLRESGDLSFAATLLVRAASDPGAPPAVVSHAARLLGEIQGPAAPPGGELQFLVSRSGEPPLPLRIVEGPKPRRDVALTDE